MTPNIPLTQSSILDKLPTEWLYDDPRCKTISRSYSLKPESCYGDTNVPLLPNLNKSARKRGFTDPSKPSPYDTLSIELANESHRDQNIAQGRRRLLARMSKLNLREKQMENDGNCLFRAIAHQLVGDQEHHLELRRDVVEYLRNHRKDYIGVYFDTKADFEKYLYEMSTPGTWGDEIILKALCEFKLLFAYVLLSTPGIPYLKYQPDDSSLHRCCKKIFLTYLSPLHYNSIIFPHGIPKSFSNEFFPSSPISPGSPAISQESCDLTCSSNDESSSCGSSRFPNVRTTNENVDHGPVWKLCRTRVKAQPTGIERWKRALMG